CPRQLRIGAGTDIANGAAHHDAPGHLLQAVLRVVQKVLEEYLAQVFEAEPSAEERRMFEADAGGHRLERLQEARILRVLQELGDGPGAGGVGDGPSRYIPLPEAQRGSENRTGTMGRGEIDQPRPAL